MEIVTGKTVVNFSEEDKKVLYKAWEICSDLANMDDLVEDFQIDGYDYLAFGRVANMLNDLTSTLKHHTSFSFETKGAY